MYPSTQSSPSGTLPASGVSVATKFRLLVLALGTFVISTGAYVLAGLLPAIRDELGATSAEVGRLTFAYTVAYAAWAPASGLLTRKWDRRLTLLAGLVLFAVGTAMSAAATSFASLGISRIVAGVGAGMFTPAAGAAAIDLVPARWRGRAVAVVIGGLAAATVLAVPISSVVSEAAGFRPVLWSVVVLAIGVALALFLLPPLRPKATGRTRGEIASLGSPVAFLLGVSLLVSVSDFTVYTYVVPLLEQLTQAGSGTIAALLFLYGCAGVVGNLLGGQLSDRWGRNKTVVTALALLAVSTALTPWAQHSVLAGLLVVVWGISGWMVVPALQNELITLRPDSAGLLATANASMIYTGMSLGSLLGGQVLMASSTVALGPASAGVAVFALLLYALRKKPECGPAGTKVGC